MSKDPLEDIYLIFLIGQTLIIAGLGLAIIKFFIKILPRL